MVLVATGAGGVPLLVLPGPCLGTRNDPLMDPLRPRVEPRKELPLFPWKLPPRNEPRAFRKEFGLIPPTPIPTASKDKNNHKFKY